MNDQNKMLAAASGALDHLFKLTTNDNILVITDSYSAAIADAFKEAGLEKGCSVSLFKIENDTRPLQEIPAELENLLPGKTTVLNIIKSFPEEISFRIKWIHKVEANKLVRMGHMPGITEEMMLHCVNVDFGGMKTTADKLIEALANAVQLHITTDAGTDIVLGVAGRKFVGDIEINPGKMGNIPCGEIYCAPLETEANGIIVFDASIGDIGLLKQPLKVYVTDGRITKVESNDKELETRIAELTDVDDEARVIGELGIGVNPGARITGNMLEDEKSLGTSHIAFGNNVGFVGGGKNNSKIHRDYLFYRPTIEIYYAKADLSSTSTLSGKQTDRKMLMNRGKSVYAEQKEPS
ncbi:MAG: aminopeptidase [Ignavibacteriae bacterium]|nr:aminopeptidase [Ignavibacteriota bacterium]